MNNILVSMTAMSLTPFIKETLKLLRASVPENIAMDQDVCARELRISGDATQLHQVLANLVNNARDAVQGMDAPCVSLSGWSHSRVMPHLGGMQLAVQLRTLKPDLPVVFLTGYDQDHVLNGDKLLPNSKVLTKPVQFDRLSHNIRDMLD